MTTQTKTTWWKVKLGEVLDLKYGLGLPEKQRGNGSVPVFGSSGIIGTHDQPAVKSDGIIVGRKGHVGSVYYSDKPFYPIDTVYFVDKLKTPGDLKFFYYLLQRIPFGKIGSDVGVPGLNRNIAYSLDILIPENPSDQKRIADILSAFDDKIELNNRISRTLEQMAQVIFKEWFVNSPSSSKRVPLTETADFVNGGALGKITNRNRKGLPLVKIAEFSRGITGNTEWVAAEVPKKYLIKNGDLLFSWSGSLELHIWHKGDAVLNQHLFNVVPKDSYTRGLLYVVLRSVLPWFKQIAQSKATSMGHIQRRHLEEQEVMITEDKNLSIFDEIYQKLTATMVENQKLAALRDLLLSKLMSGEIRV